MVPTADPLKNKGRKPTLDGAEFFKNKNLSMSQRLDTLTN